MVKLVSAIDQAEKNILDHIGFLAQSPELQDRTSMHRAWYAVKKGGNWHFGNSKIVGYLDLTPAEYLKGGFDGRETEAVLQKWFTEVSPKDPLHDELWQALAEFLSEYGKRPSKLARINIPNAMARPSKLRKSDAIADLILEVAKDLDMQTIKVVRRRLKALL